MPTRRILSLWFPRLAAERILRVEPGLVVAPFAVVGDQAGTQVLTSLSGEASRAGLRRGQPLRDARAMCPELVTRLTNPRAEADFLATLQRWAGKFSPWVALEAPSGLVVDLTGCAHLFGGEAALMEQVEEECAGLGLSVQAAIADTLGAAWALARYGQGGAVTPLRSGDAIDQEARATRSRAVRRRHWERGGAPPQITTQARPAGRIAPVGQSRTAIAGLPIAALRLPEAVSAQLSRLGLRRIEDLANQPRAGLGRRFGQEVMLRLDQAFGTVPEPVSPAAVASRFAVRLTLPEPIGLESDLLAGLDRLLPELETRLRARGQGARRVRFRVELCDHTSQWIEIGLARPSADPERLRPLLRMKLGDIDAGPGIDVLRLEAHVTEPVHAVQHRGQLAVSGTVVARATGVGSGAGADRGFAAPPQTGSHGAPDMALDDLIGRLGARVGLEEILRLHPADTHIPEKSTQVRAAAWAEAATDWPVPAPVPRPLTICRPEPVHVPTPAAARATADVPPPAPDGPARPTHPPERFRWRGRLFEAVSVSGPERIAPEWWLDTPEWRTGVRDYWRVEVASGERLWLYFAHGGTMSAGWFCQGAFA